MLPKVTLICLQSLDGFLARTQTDDLSWGSPEDKKHFKTKVQSTGAMIIGRNTFDQMGTKLFNSQFVLVLTSQAENYTELKTPNRHFFNGTPLEALKYLESIEITEVVLGGGGNINNQFLASNLVDEIFITIGAKIFGEGIKVFGEKPLGNNLELLSLEKLGKDDFLIHYKVQK